MAQSVAGKTAIVTGAGSGINLEFARLLLKGGANVLFADLALRPEAEALVAAYGSKAVFQRTDVTSWADLTAMFAACTTAFGPTIDIVCPGAGVFKPPFSAFWYPPGTGPSQDEPNGDRYKLVDINITHPIRVTQMAISHFLAQDPPSSPSNPKSLVHITSIAGEGASLPFPLYHTSKWALMGFIRSLADLERHVGIRVAGVAPGVVKTPLWTDNPDKLRLVKEAGENPDTWVTPEEVAEVMLALVQSDSVTARDTPEAVPVTGGCVIESAAGSVRSIPLFDNPGPAALGQKGTSVSNAADFYIETVGLLKPGWGKA